MGGSLVRCKRKRFERTRQACSSKLASRPYACLHPRASPSFFSCHLPVPLSRTGQYSRSASSVFSLCLSSRMVRKPWKIPGLCTKTQPVTPPPASPSPSSSLHSPISSIPFSSSSSPLPSSESPTSSSDLPPPPLPSPVFTRYAGKEVITESLDTIKRAIEDVKGAINAMQHREKEQTRCEEHLTTLLQDLRQAISDTGALSRDTMQDQMHEQRLDPISG